MGSSSDSSFSFGIGKRHQFDSPVQPPKKLQLRENTVKAAVLHIKTLNLPLISSSTSQFCESLFLQPYKPYTIGRNFKLCDFVFADGRVSRWHCQLYFDSFDKKIYLSDGLVLGCCTGTNDSLSSFGSKISTNGVFLNEFRINGVVELQVGDVVELVCRNKEACGLGARIGFLVEKAIFMEEVDYRNSMQLSSCNLHSKQTNFTLKCRRVTDNTSVLLSRCRDILCSDDPVYYIRKFDTSQRMRIHLPLRYFSDDGVESCSSSGLRIRCHKRKRVYSMDVEAENCQSSPKEITVISEENAELEGSNFVSAANTYTALKKCNDIFDVQHASVAGSNYSGFSLGKVDSYRCKELLDAKNSGGCILPPGKKFYLNRLRFRGQDNEEIVNVVSLPELFDPIESLEQVFIATFTSDIPW